MQIETTDLRGRDIDVVRTGQIGGVGTSQKTETVGQYFKRTVTENLFAAFRFFLEDGEHEFLLSHALGIVDIEGKSHIEQLRNMERFEIGKMHSVDNG